MALRSLITKTNVSQIVLRSSSCFANVPCKNYSIFVNKQDEKFLKNKYRSNNFIASLFYRLKYDKKSGKQVRIEIVNRFKYLFISLLFI